MAGETFQPIEFSNNSSPYISDTNLNLMQSRIDNAIKTEKNRITDLKQMGSIINTSTTGWYRVATIYGTAGSGTLPGKGAIIEIVPSWNQGSPSSVMLSILSVYKKIKITQINAVAVYDNVAPITRARALYDDTNGCFYIDVYYTYNTPNSIYVKNIALLDSDSNGGVEINNPVIETFSGTSLSEITIGYARREPIIYNLENYCINNWQAYGQCFCKIDESGVKHMQVSCNYGTNTNVMQLPDELKPNQNVFANVTNLTDSGYALIAPNGTIAISSNIFTSGSTQIVFSAIYR